MKNRTRNDYLQRIDRVIALLEQAVNQGGELPDPARLAEVAHLSPFHFHRVYRALTGETLGGTVMRLRMLRALRLLANPEQPITEAALAVGYETPQAFTRAFRQIFDATPSEWRGQDERLAEAIERMSHAPADVAQASAPLQVEVVSMEPFRVVVLRNRGDYADLDKAYGRLFAWAAEQGVVPHISGIYGWPANDSRDTSPADCEFDCALAFDRTVGAGEDMRMQSLGGGRWARLRYLGSYVDTGIEDATDVLLAQWLPASGYGLRDVSLFHHYLDDPEQTPEAMLRTDIYIPLS